MNWRESVPWQAKIGAKLVLSRLPAGYGLWQRLWLFRHGRMDDPSYAFQVFCRHFERAAFERNGRGFTVLELGPGDSVATALIAYAFGASRTYLVDVAPFATTVLAPYRAMAAFLRDQGMPVPDLTGVESLPELLDRCRAEYLTEGLRSLRSLPAASADLVWSQAVLEHVRRGEFLDTVCELRRLVRPGGVSSHRVDLRDHLGGALNNLRFSRRLWESEFMASSGFYTNRIRFSEMLSLFEHVGFRVEQVAAERWERLPTRRAKLDPEFRALPEDDLTVSGFDVVLRPA